MDVPVDKRGAVAAFVPLRQRVVAEDDVPVAILYMCELVHTLQILCRVLALHRDLVVVSEDKMLMPIELPQIPVWAIFRFVAEVPNNIHVIVLLDAAVPEIDHSPVHLFYIGEWAVVETDDVLMPKMQITDI
jgi:NAD-dependent oxidoreductase involved in siderophore biosynthesis